MAAQTRAERRLQRRLARTATPRGAAIVIAVATTLITVVAGLMMTVIDHTNFPSLGGGLWWAVQTITTVGYGDHVPSNTAGRIVAAFVMLLGIGFITVLTASITGAFVEGRRQPEPAGGVGSAATEEHLKQIDGRLERIEALLSTPG